MSRHVCIRCGRKRDEKFMEKFQHRGKGFVIQWYDGWVCQEDIVGRPCVPGASGHFTGTVD